MTVQTDDVRIEYRDDGDITISVPPQFIRPCIPTTATAKAIPQGDAWLHEPKLDGNRLQVTLVRDAAASSGGDTGAPTGADLSPRAASSRSWSAESHTRRNTLLPGMILECEHAVCSLSLALSAFDVIAYREGRQGVHPAPACKP